MHSRRLERGIRATTAILLALLTPAIIAAQQVTFSGRVTAESGQPISGAGASITEIGAGATTNPEARYTFTIDQRPLPPAATPATRCTGYKPRQATDAAPTGHTTRDS